MKTMAAKSNFVWDQDGKGVFYERSLLPGPLRFGRCTAFVDAKAEEKFVLKFLDFLHARGIAYVQLGNTMSGCAEPLAEFALKGTKISKRNTILLDLNLTEEELLKQMAGSERKIRKAIREGVSVRVIEEISELQQYAALSNETSERVRGQEAYTVYPAGFFEVIFNTMAKRGDAIFLISEFEGRPISANLFFRAGEALLYFHGASTRDRTLTKTQGVALNFWEAIKMARKIGCRYFDLGGCTVTDDPDSRGYGVYNFKKKWGGSITTFYNIEQINSAFQYQFQESVLSPLWNKVHPYLFLIKNFGRRDKALAEA